MDMRLQGRRVMLLLAKAIVARQPQAPRSEACEKQRVAQVGKVRYWFALELDFVPKWSYTDLQRFSSKLWADWYKVS